jgi:hypothetical protein
MSAALKKAATLTALLAFALALSACGSDSGDDAATGDTGPGAAPALSDGRYFAADSPWNAEIESLPVSPHSERMLRLALQRRAVIEEPGQEGIETVERTVDDGFYVNSRRWAPLIVRAGGDGAVATEMVCRQSRCGPEPERVPSVLALPPGTRPDPRYDGWLSVIDPATGVGYDFWRARRQSGDTISYQYAKPWALDGPGFSRPISVDPVRAAGARGSGLPLFAGVIGPGELGAGEIDHALALSVPGLARRNYVQPASVTDGVGSTDSLPAGARLRLKASVQPPSDEESRRPAVEAILVALRRYGAIVVDRAAVPTLYAAQGTPANLIQEDELDWLHLDDFEVIALPPLEKDPPLGQVQQAGLVSVADDRPQGVGG